MQHFRNIALTFLLTALPIVAWCTHNRAGEITYRHISGFTFEFTVTTYTYSLSGANREELTVNWGDGTSDVVRILRAPIVLPNNYLFNTYVARHTYPGTGIYEILMEDPNRNDGVINIPNSVNTIFSIKTIMRIGSFSGTNSTPILLNPPIDNAGVGHLFIHNPAAFDPDGDSLSYELTTCTAENGIPISGYTLPPASDILKIDPVSGDLIWDTPVDSGVYNIAIYVNEWRNGTRIGRIARDMQIDVFETDNNPPKNADIPDFCVEAGDSIEFIFDVTDIDGDSIDVEMRGGPLLDGSANFKVTQKLKGLTKGRFIWRTKCAHAQQQPYTLILKSRDDVKNDIQLVDISSFFVKVIHSAPQGLKLKPGNDTIRVEWNQSTCGNPAGYRIYRKIAPSGFVPDSCENGVPAYTGYELLDIVNGGNNTSYTDDNLGQGLVPGFDYCYMVTAFYFDDAESFATPEVCTTLVAGTPPMLQVSVEANAIDSGVIFVSWALPQGVDTIDDGPYRYDVLRKAPGENELSKIAEIASVDLTDTTYLDQNINTLVFPYHYSVKVYYEDDQGNYIEVPGSETATSLYLDLYGSDNEIRIEMIKRAPWLNYEYSVFKGPGGSGIFDSIGFSSTPEYLDKELQNGVAYTYKVNSLGTRPLYGRNYIIKNKSHINTGEAIDTIPPCPPLVEVNSICEGPYNDLIWTSPKSLCGSDDVVRYEVYYKPTLEDDFNLIRTQTVDDTTFRHNENIESLAAVYGVVAVDSFNNKSNVALAIIDTCLLFDLPNVFSPDGDGKNDIYVSLNLGGFVKEVDMKIFNRHGQLVYETNDPDINWYGVHKNTKRLVPTGVYYYICDVFEPRLTGLKQRNLKGFIHVYSGKSNPKE